MSNQNVDLSIFESEAAMDAVLNDLAKGLGAFQADPEDPKGREQMRSVARQIASKKTAIDAAGKELVSEWKNSAKRVDALRKTARDTLDGLRDKVRKPADDYEAEQQRVAAAKAAAEEQAKADAEAKRIAAIEAREREIEQREADLRAAIELKEREAREAREAKEREARAEQEARDRAEREERIRIEAETRAREQAEAEARQREEQAKREAEQQAERERQAELAEEAKRQRAERNKKHREAVHASVLDDLASIGVNNGELILDALLAGKIGRLAIDYSVRDEAA